MKTWFVTLLLVAGTSVALSNTASADPYPCVPTGTFLDNLVVCTDQQCGPGLDCVHYVPYCAQKFIGTGFHVDYLFFCASKLRNGLLP
ncbi:MAG TPA: hypothetical protein VNX21_04215 [Candidatus Thermoplasmatota archaeon]|nr:hypothetical protein [Candidatus Thermoplasmatota archaeon]